GGAEHRSTISAPGMTLAIRSSDVVMGFDAAFGGGVVIVDSPRTQVENRRQRLINLANGSLNENDASPGENALAANSIEAFRTFGSSPEDAHDRRHLPGYDYIRRGGDLGFRRLIGSGSGEFTTFNPRFDQIETNHSPINFRIFDLGSIDGDIVNVYWNGSVISS